MIGRESRKKDPRKKGAVKVMVRCPGCAGSGKVFGGKACKRCGGTGKVEGWR